MARCAPSFEAKAWAKMQAKEIAMLPGVCARAPDKLRSTRTSSSTKLATTERLSASPSISTSLRSLPRRYRKREPEYFICDHERKHRVSVATAVFDLKCSTEDDVGAAGPKSSAQRRYGAITTLALEGHSRRLADISKKLRIRAVSGARASDPRESRVGQSAG